MRVQRMGKDSPHALKAEAESHIDPDALEAESGFYVKMPFTADLNPDRTPLEGSIGEITPRSVYTVAKPVQEAQPEGTVELEVVPVNRHIADGGNRGNVVPGKRIPAGSTPGRFVLPRYGNAALRCAPSAKVTKLRIIRLHKQGGTICEFRFADLYLYPVFTG